MIVTVTLNTAIDKLYLVDELLPFEVGRVREVVNTAGGNFHFQCLKHLVTSFISTL